MTQQPGGRPCHANSARSYLSVRFGPAAAVNPSISRPMPGQPARLAFQTITRDVDIHLMDLEARLVNDTIGSTPFSNSTRIEGPARFSPDGSRIAFESSRSGGPAIDVYRFSDRRVARVGRLAFPYRGLQEHGGVSRRSLGISNEDGAVRY